MSKYMKVTSSVADAYRSMHEKIDEEILNEELIDSLIEDVRDEEINDWLDYLDEDKDLNEDALEDKAKESGISVGTLRKVFDRGMAAWKTGHRPGTTAQQWGYARVNAFIKKKKSGKLNHDQDLAHIIHPDDSMLDESYSKEMPLKTYADRVGINAKEKQWIMDNEKDEPMYFPNDKFKSSLVLSYPVRDGDYYFSFLTDYGKGVNLAKQSNLKMNLLLQKEYKQALAKSKIDFKKEPEKLYALSGHLWNIMSKAFEKLPKDLGAGDTMTRDELYLAIDHLVGEPPMFESYDYQGETIQEGRLSGMLATIANKIRSAKKKIGKRIKLGRKAKGLDSIKENESPKYDANILKSVADTYASMQNYGIQGDIVEETQLDEVKRQEVDAMKKVSKDMQSVLKSYQKIANMGDKELKNTVHNKSYKQVLDARDTILKMIGTLNTKMLMQKEDFELVEASAGEMIDKLFNLKGNKDAGYGVAKLLSMTGVKVIQAMQKQNPQGFMKTVIALGKEKGKMRIPTNNALMKMFKQQGVKPLPEELDNDDKPVVKKIVTMLKKASKKHAKQAGDLEKAVSEELEENTKTSLPMPRLKKSGKFSISLVFPAPNTMYSIRFRNESFMIAPDEVKDLIKILSQRDIVTKNPKGMAKLPEAVSEAVSEELDEAISSNQKAMLKRVKARFPRLSQSEQEKIAMIVKPKGQIDSKLFVDLGNAYDKRDLKTLKKLMTNYAKKYKIEGKNFAQQAAIAIAKKKSGKYDKDGKKINASHCSEDLDEKVKDGKVDPLSKMGKSKLTGQEINRYYRENPKQKAAARDKTVKKAIELALDLSGATNYAIKEIEKLKKGLSKLPAVKLALQHANESKEFTGHHVVIEQLSGANMVKLKTYGKMMAKMTKLPFDENDPEKGIDKLMGQVWKQKHVPANWERLHKMVMMLKGIGVKMPSLKGKYMGLDPVSKKAIFYKEGTDEIVDWNNDISEIKEGIEEIVEAQEMKDADVKKIAQMTDRNDHNGSLMYLAKVMGDRKSGEALKGIMQTHKALGHMPKGLFDTRMAIFDDLMKQSKKKYRNHNDIYSAL